MDIDSEHISSKLCMILRHDNVYEIQQNLKVVKKNIDVLFLKCVMYNSINIIKYLLLCFNRNISCCKIYQAFNISCVYNKIEFIELFYKYIKSIDSKNGVYYRCLTQFIKNSKIMNEENISKWSHKYCCCESNQKMKKMLVITLGFCPSLLRDKEIFNYYNKLKKIKNIVLLNNYSKYICYHITSFFYF